MQVYTELLPPTISCKSGAINWRPVTDDGFVCGVLSIHGKTSVAYTVSEFATGWAGRGFTLAKLTTGTDPEAESYSVFCANAGSPFDTCDCKGFSYRSNCKHVASVRALLANEWL